MTEAEEIKHELDRVLTEMCLDIQLHDNLYRWGCEFIDEQQEAKNKLELIKYWVEHCKNIEDDCLDSGFFWDVKALIENEMDWKPELNSYRKEEVDEE